MNGNMNFLKKCIFILFFLFISCSGDEGQLYEFPSLSQGQLIDLKKISETIEGFFVTTDLSDLDSAWAERGFYIYVCIRFLNDKAINEKLKKSAIPLLVQVSNDKDKPAAESVLLLHPKTAKPEAGGVFYYEEKQHFQLTDSPITIRDMEYNIFDVEFNQKGKITRMSFIKKGTDVENFQEIREAAAEAGTVEEETVEEETVEEETTEEETTEEETAEEETAEEDKKDLLLEVRAFAKQFSDTCTDWPVLKYKHEDGLPDYLQVDYKGEGNGGNPKGGTSGGSGGPPPISSGAQKPIPEDAPHIPVE